MPHTRDNLTLSLTWGWSLAENLKYYPESLTLNGGHINIMLSDPKWPNPPMIDKGAVAQYGDIAFKTLFTALTPHGYDIRSAECAGLSPESWVGKNDSDVVAALLQQSLIGILRTLDLDADRWYARGLVKRYSDTGFLFARNDLTRVIQFPHTTPEGKTYLYTFTAKDNSVFWQRSPLSSTTFGNESERAYLNEWTHDPVEFPLLSKEMRDALDEAKPARGQTSELLAVDSSPFMPITDSGSGIPKANDGAIPPFDTGSSETEK